MSDVLYILGRGSKHEDMELRLSLRCLAENARNIDRVFIVGNCPDWVHNVKHIPAEDTWTAENNAFQKILKACDSDISNDFLLMNDDFFMLTPFDAETYPDFFFFYLKDRIKPDLYGKCIENTYNFLKEHGKPRPLDFDVHCPMIINKGAFLLLKETAEKVKNDDTGLLCRSLYGNIFNKTGVGCIDPKLREDVWKEPSLTGCISTSDNCDSILKELENRFNKKSRWEK